MKVISKIFKFRRFRAEDASAAKSEALCDGSEGAAARAALRLRARVACDAAGAAESVGDSPATAIPVHGAGGALSYLSCLVAPGTEMSFAHKTGEADGAARFEIVSANGAVWRTLFLKLDAAETARTAPKGFALIGDPAQPAFLTAVSERLERFPYDLPAALRRESLDRFGTDLSPPRLLELLARNLYARPAGGVSAANAPSTPNVVDAA